MINFIIEENIVKFKDRRKRKEVGAINKQNIVSLNEDTCIMEILQMNVSNSVKIALINACKAYCGDTVRIFEYKLENVFKELETALESEMDILICKTASVNDVRNSASKLATAIGTNVKTQAELKEIYNSLDYNKKKAVMFKLYGRDFSKKLLTERANGLAMKAMPEFELKTIATFSKFFGFSL